MAVQINVAANQAALTASIQAGVQAYNQRFAQNNQLNLTVNQRAFSQPLGRMTGDVKDFEAALAASNARVIAFGASTAVLGGVIRSFKELANVTIEVEKNLADINRVFGLTTSQLQKFSSDLFNVTKLTASSFNDASQAALEFSRQGLKAEETLQRTKDALTLTRLAGISTASAVDALTSTVNGFAASGISTTQILNKLVAVEQDYAVGAGDLAEALSRTGQAAQEAGVSLDQLNALVTSAQQSTARGGAVIGNALKTIFTRLQRTETLDQLEAFNIGVRDIQGNILPAVQILQNFAGAYKGLADAQRAQLSEQVAGVYQVNILKAIVNDLNKSQGTYAGALQRGASATNEAEVATAKLNQTLDALLKQTATSTQQLANNIGKVTFEPLAKYGTEQLKSFIESANELLEGEGVGSTFANGFLKGIRNVIAGPGAIAAFFTLFKLIQNSFTYLGQALPQIAGITTETQNRKNIEQSILQIMQQQGPASQALAGLMGNQAAQAQLLLQIARQQTAEYQAQSTLAKQLASQLASQGVRVKGSGGLQVTRAGGYIPNATRMAEVVGAQAGGYTPGRVVSSPVGGVMNTAEDVKYIPGFAQPFINPPAGSKAGRAHRQNAINRTGVDPYMYSGFIPNFAEILDVAARPYDVKDGDTVTADATIKRIRDFRLEKVDAVESNQRWGLAAKGLALKYYPTAEKFAPAINATGKAAYDRLSFISNDLSEGLISKGYGVPDLRYIDEKDLIDKTLKAKKAKKGLWQEIDSQGNYAHPKAIQFLSQSDIAASDKELEDKKDAMYKVARAGRKKFGDLSVFSGFIPNFAPPTSAIRIPWFKKFGNPAFDAIQPALGISKASDTETFRQINFKSAAEGADERGDSNIFAPLFEDFAFKAMQLVSQQDVKDDLIRGYVLQPGTNQKQSALDAALKEAGVGIEYKGYPKKNLTGSITGELTRKYETLSKTNPAAAAKLKELIIAFNEVGHENQITSELGKKLFSPLAGVSYSQMVKNSPDLVKGLSAETNSLLNSYVKNPAFLAMASASGFIPNFAYKQAVMGLEESMSGNKAIFDTKPFPHIRNSSQPTFSSAIADHGGLGNALSDSMRGQKAAGLMSKGFIPNFANSRSARRRMSRNQTQSQTQNTQSGFDPYKLQAESERIAKDVIKKIKYAYDYVGVFAAAFADTVEKGSQQAKTAIGSGMSKIKKSIGIFSQATSNTASKNQTVIAQTTTPTNQPKNGFLTKIGSSLGRAFANPVTAMLLPQITSAIGSQFAYGDKKRYELSESERVKQNFASTGVSAISTGAFLGTTVLGPGLGTVVGAAAGGLLAFTQAAKAAKLSLSEFKDSINETVQKQANSIGAYKASVDDLTKATESGDKASIEDAKKNLAAALSSLSSSDLLGKVQGKSTKELDLIISDMNRRAALSTNILSGTEKLGTGGKELSFFDRFKQQSGEAIIDFTDTVLDGFKFLGEGFVKVFGKVWDTVTELFNSFSKNFLTTWENLLETYGSLMSLSGLKIQQIYYNILDSLGFDKSNELEQNQNAIDSYSEILDKNFSSLTSAISNAAEGIFKSYMEFDLGEFFSKGMIDIGEAAGVSGERKIANYDMDAIVSQFLGKGGASGSSEFYKRIFSLGQQGKKGDLKDQALYETIDLIGKSTSSKERENAIQTLRDALISRNVSGEDIDVLVTQLRELGKTGNYKGQFILTQFESFISKISAFDATTKALGDQQVADIDNYTAIKNAIETSINKYVLESEKNQISINASIERQKALINERSRISDVFGRPFESVKIKKEERMLDISGSYQADMRKANERILQNTASLRMKVAPQSLKSLQDLQTKLSTGEYTPEQRLEELKKFVESSDTIFSNAADRNAIIQTINEENGLLEKRSIQNKEDVRTAELVYDIELKRLNEARDFTFQLKAGISSLNDEGKLLMGKLGNDIPRMFGDGLVDGIKAAIRESDNLGDALLGVAAKFLDEISTTMMRAGVYQLLGSFGMNIPGVQAAAGKQKGGIIRAQSGMYVSGTGSGDKYPALLENGEYVLNRRAVMAMGGPATLDTLNFSMAPRFASGGSFQAELTDLAAMESGMTTYGLEQSKLYGELRDEQRAKAEEKRRKDFARKQQTAQMIGSLAAAVVTAGIGAGISNKMSNVQAGKAQNLSAKLQTGAPLSAAESSSIRGFMDKGLLNPSGVYTGPQIVRTGFSGFTGYTGRQTGGLIGSRLSDTIPGYMEGGLYNSPIVKKYGVGMQSGGMSPVSNNSSNVVNNSNASNSFNFNTTVNRDGTIQMGANNTSYKQQDVELSNNLNTKIYGAVLDVIRDQQRFGGSLAGTRRA